MTTPTLLSLRLTMWRLVCVRSIAGVSFIGVCLLFGRGVAGQTHSLKRHYKRLLVAITALTFQMLLVPLIHAVAHISERVLVAKPPIDSWPQFKAIVERVMPTILQSPDSTQQVIWVITFSSLLLLLQVRYLRTLAPTLILVQSLAIMAKGISIEALVPFVMLTLLFIAVVVRAPLANRFAKALWLVCTYSIIVVVVFVFVFVADQRCRVL
jgi:hypothetical protein